MSELTKVPHNVWKFIDKAESDVARMEGARFAQEMYCQIVDLGMSSPIEQLFFVALHTVAKSDCVDLNPDPYELRGEMLAASGIYVSPQHRLGKFKLDFLITRIWREHVDFGKRGIDRHSSIVVELDGHQFHDRDKHQRSYEKARDRFLQKEGYKVLHYTGSDVATDPYRVAHEVLDMVGAFGQPRAYDPKNPLSLD